MSNLLKKISGMAKTKILNLSLVRKKSIPGKHLELVTIAQKRKQNLNQKRKPKQ